VILPSSFGPAASFFRGRTMRGCPAFLEEFIYLILAISNYLRGGFRVAIMI
jgi:hypothetical protein